MLELVIIFPVVMLLLFGTVQAGLWFHAREVARKAAQAGVDAGRSWHAQPGDGPAAAQDFLHRMGHSVEAPQVANGGAPAGQVRIEVRGKVATLIPGWELSVHAQAEAPLERWTP